MLFVKLETKVDNCSPSGTGENFYTFNDFKKIIIDFFNFSIVGFAIRSLRLRIIYAPQSQIKESQGCIRDIYEKNRQKVKEALRKLNHIGVACCFFVHSF